LKYNKTTSSLRLTPNISNLCIYKSALSTKHEFCLRSYSTINKSR